ncbi:hypothetical protein DRQ29_04410 [bacterium]|nr:MAG: hypothetical protein DRQ29_04410 [bacterium]
MRGETVNEQKNLSMKQQLKLLLKVQEYDSKLLELDMRKSFFPDLLTQLKTEMEKLKEEYETKKNRLTEVKKEIDFLEIELEENEKKLKSSQERLSTVSTNKEYDAVQLEIQTLEEKIADTEQRSIVLLDEQSSLEKEVAELEEKVKNTIERNKAQIEEIEKNSSEIDGLIEKIREERDEIASQISRPLLSKYRQIRKGRQGVAVVPIVDRACGGCRQALPPQKIQDIRAGKLTICENCGRIIVELETLDD